MVTLIVVALSLLLLAGVIRSKAWAAGGLIDRLFFGLGALSGSTIFVYAGAVARAALAFSAVFAILELEAYPPHCATDPVDDCYAIERNAFMILLMVGPLVPLTGLAGAILVFVFRHPVLRALGFIFCAIAVVVTAKFVTAGGDVLWLDQPRVHLGK